MTAYYNEIDPYAAQWLRNLIAAGHIAPGEVDERSITEIAPDDLQPFTQCHFFAGIGVWSHALRRAGWADDVPVWTGSCPCQPFSAAGRQAGFDDSRHLWPTWFRLIAECRPAVVLGEQVASALPWVDLVSADLEGAGYAFGASDLCAAGFGGAHIRQRLYFVGLADAGCSLGQRGAYTSGPAQADAGQRQQGSSDDQPCSRSSGLADTSHPNRGSGERGTQAGVGPDAEWGRGLASGGAVCGMEHSEQPGLEGHAGHGDGSDQPGRVVADEAGSVAAPGGAGRMADDQRERREVALLDNGSSGTPDSIGEAGLFGVRGPTDGQGTRSLMLGRNAADWLFCREGKWRPVEPGTFPLADAAPARVGRLRAYGNGLDAETATQFCEAVREIIGQPSGRTEAAQAGEGQAPPACLSGEA